MATINELRHMKQSRTNQWSSTERNRPKSFLVCFSARYNIEQMIMVRSKYRYDTMNSSTNGSNQNAINGTNNLGFENESDCSNPKELNAVFCDGVNTNSVDGLKVFALVWMCLANFYLLGYQTQMLPSVGKFHFDFYIDLYQFILSGSLFFFTII